MFCYGRWYFPNTSIAAWHITDTQQAFVQKTNINTVQPDSLEDLPFYVNFRDCYMYHLTRGAEMSAVCPPKRG